MVDSEKRENLANARRKVCFHSRFLVNKKKLIF
jgi:hypothetical protein